MLSEEQIKQALHAYCVRPLGVASPHGPLGLEHLAESVSRLSKAQATAAQVERSISLPVDTWQKLADLARDASRAHSHALTASEVAAAIVEQAVHGK
jgi:hypothetical protein